MNDEYRPRFSFEISEEQKARADKLLSTHGIRRAIFNVILNDVLDLVEDYGGIAIGVMMSGKAKPRDVLPSMNSVKEITK